MINMELKLKVNLNGDSGILEGIQFGLIETKIKKKENYIELKK